MHKLCSIDGRASRICSLEASSAEGGYPMEGGYQMEPVTIPSVLPRSQASAAHVVHAQALFHRRQAPRICLLDMLGLEAEAECDAAAAPADVAPSEALSAWSGRSIPLALLQRDTLSTEELVTRSGVEEATPALISALLQLVEASEALPMCPLPAYLSKAAGLRMLSEPLILAVGSGLYTEP